MVTPTPAPDSARRRHTERIAAVRRGIELGLFIWPAFILVDWWICAFVEPNARLALFAATRGLGQLVLFAVWLRLRLGAPPGPRTLAALDGGVVMILSALISAGASEYGGIESPLALGVVTVLIARAVLLSDPPGRAIATLTPAFVAYPATILTLATVNPTMGQQLEDPRALATFALLLMFVAASAFVAVLMGRTTWQLQTEIKKTTSLDRYKLIERIGKGGMGDVWRAHDQNLHRDVAVKILANPGTAPDPAVVARFEREARATANLRHPHTIRVFDFGAAGDGTLYYAMELLDGRDLKTIIHQHRLQEASVVRIGVQLCESLAEAHALGLVHRDIKPGNIFIARYAGHASFVKLLDFGLAKAISPKNEDGEALTRAGFAVGTPEYMAPESLLGGDADARTDIYSLGTVLYYALTGRGPHTGTLTDQLRARMSTPPTRPSLVAGQPISGRLEAVLMRALKTDPDERFQSALEMAAALEACLTDEHGGQSVDDITLVPMD